MNKDTLTKEYYENKLTLKEIAEKYNSNYTKIYKLFISYDLKTNNVINSEKELTLEQEQFVFAKLIGDGCITKSRHHAEYHFEFSHEEKQRDYAVECADILKDFGTYSEKTRSRDPRLYKKHTWVECCFKSIHNKDFTRIYRYFYENGKKVINSEILSMIDEKGLAIWYQDDGHKDKNSKAGYLNTHSFTLEENQLIVNWLQSKFSIKANTVKAGMSRSGVHQLYRIRISSGSFGRFCNLIEPYIVISLKYKLG